PLPELGDQVHGEVAPRAGGHDDLPVDPRGLPRGGEPEHGDGGLCGLAEAVRATHGHAPLAGERAEDVLLVGGQALPRLPRDAGPRPPDRVVHVAQDTAGVAAGPGPADGVTHLPQCHDVPGLRQGADLTLQVLAGPHPSPPSASSRVARISSTRRCASTLTRVGASVPWNRASWRMHSSTTFAA